MKAIQLAGLLHEAGLNAREAPEEWQQRYGKSCVGIHGLGFRCFVVHKIRGSHWWFEVLIGIKYGTTQNERYAGAFRARTVAKLVLDFEGRVKARYATELLR